MYTRWWALCCSSISEMFLLWKKCITLKLHYIWIYLMPHLQRYVYIHGHTAKWLMIRPQTMEFCDRWWTWWFCNGKFLNHFKRCQVLRENSVSRCQIHYHIYKVQELHSLESPTHCNCGFVFLLGFLIMAEPTALITRPWYLVVLLSRSKESGMIKRFR